MGEPKDLRLRGEIEVEVRDKDGELIHFHKEEAHSWLVNFLHWLRAFFYQQVGVAAGGTETVTDTSGASQSIVYGSTTGANAFFGVRAPAGDDSYGLIMGMGSLSVIPEDYQLAAKISEGTGVNQMNYGGVTVEALTSITNGYQFRVIRTATNNSGGAITVSEIGIVAELWEVGGTRIFMLVARDVLTTSVSVPAGSTITVRYIISFTV